MAGVRNSQPSSLAPMIPTSDLATSVTPQVGPMPMMQQAPVPMADQGIPQSIAAPQAMDDMEADFRAMGGADDDMEADFAAMGGPKPEDPQLEAMANDKKAGYLDGALRMGERAQASFAKSPEQIEGMLAKKYGKKNVKMIDEGKNFVIKDEGKWRSFVPDGYLNDVPGIIAGGASTAVKEATALPFEIGAGYAAAAATAGTAGVALPSVPVIMGAGRVAGGIAGENMSQLVGDALGFDQGSFGERQTQALLGGTVRAAFGLATDKLGAGIRTLAGNRMAKRAADKSLQVLAPLPGDEAALAVGATKELMEETRVLADKGIIKGIEEAEGAFLVPADANGAVPELVKSGKEAGIQQRYRNFMSKRGEVLAEGWQKVHNIATDMTDGMAARIASSGTATVKQASVADRAWGATIGKMRDEFREEAGNGFVPTQKLQAAVQESFKDMGYSFKANGDVDRIPGVEQIAANLRISESEAKQLSTKVMGLFDKIRSGGRKGFLRADQLESELSTLMRQTNAGFRSSSASYEANAAFLKLKNAARDDFSEGFGTLLGEQSKQKYQQALSNFSKIKSASDDLAGIFKNDETTSQAMVQHLFGGNGASLDRIQAMKNILSVEDPKAWNTITSEWLGQLTRKHSVVEDGGQMIGKTNWRAVQKELRMKPEILESAFGKENSATINSFLNVAGKVQDSVGAQGVFTAKEFGSMTPALIDATKLAHSNLGAAVELFSRLGGPKGEKAMLENLTRGGREQLISRVSAGNRPAVTNFLDTVVERLSRPDPLETTIANQLRNQGARSAAPAIRGATNSIMAQPQQEMPAE